MKKIITITLEGGRQVTVPTQTLVGELLERPFEESTGLPYLGALVNNELVTFGYALDIDSTVRFVTMKQPSGLQIYVRSLSFLLAKAVKDAFPAASFSVEHAIGPALYCEFSIDGKPGMDTAQAATLEKALRLLVDQDLPIQRSRMSYTAAIEQFTRNGQDDKVALLRHRNTPKVVTYVCDGFCDLAYGPMTRSTGGLKFFHIQPYSDGFVLLMPSADSAPEIPEFKPIRSLTATFKESNHWGRILGVNTVGRLNDIIAAGEIGDFIKVAEALHEKKIAQIADQIASTKSARWILIAGPSSSGKTTFAKRLAIQLRVCGLRPVTLGGDDYFVDREKTPKTETGEYDFEHLNAMDIEALNKDLTDLDAFREIKVPTYDFHLGKRIYKGKTMHLEPGQVVILEGIHSLDPNLTPSVPADKKFHIFISAMTQLNLDHNNRIPTTDNRFIRRLVRDHRYRGHSAERTLAMWPNVGRGERRWIFPFQDNADAVFNSALDYELAVLATEARSLLADIKPDTSLYAEARRIMEFLSQFLPVSRDLAPPTSILREFIGGSSFEY
ncbi:MAG: nucleoside kinase [Kiritimatiellae bacterium]|nr:nucleoside kinase [Kiritimatiellia bacterium]